MKISELDTSKVRSEAIRIDLNGYSLQIGKKKVDLSGQWIEVLPTDSNEFNDAKLDQFRRAAKGEKVETGELIACLIVAWSFDDPCDAKNKLEAVKTFPRVLIDYVDKVASQSVNFIMNDQAD